MEINSNIKINTNKLNQFNNKITNKLTSNTIVPNNQFNLQNLSTKEILKKHITEIVEFCETADEEIKENQLLKDKDYKSLTVSAEYIDIVGMSDEEKANFFSNLQKDFDKELAACNTSREKATTAAKFLATKIPKLPYFWGGGHFESKEEMLGINTKIGSYQKVTDPSSKSYKAGNDYIYAYDCSGLVSWCLLNSGYPNIDRSLVVDELATIGNSTKESITSDNIINKIKPGDLAIQDGHIGIIIGVDKEKNEISIVHESGSGGGMNITTQSTITGKITKDDVGATNDINQNNKTISSRVGNDYFTEIVLMDY